MSIATATTGWVQATDPRPVSRGTDRTVLVGDVTLSNDYDAGGDTITFPGGYGTLRALYCSPQVMDGLVLSWNGDDENPAIMVYEVDGGNSVLAEVADATDNSGISVTVVATFES